MVYQSSSVGPIRSVNKVGSAVAVALRDITPQVEKVAARIDQLPDDLKKTVIPEVMARVAETLKIEHQRIPDTVERSLRKAAPVLGEMVEPHLNALLREVSLLRQDVKEQAAGARKQVSDDIVPQLTTAAKELVAAEHERLKETVPAILTNSRPDLEAFHEMILQQQRALERTVVHLKYAIAASAVATSTIIGGAVIVASM